MIPSPSPFELASAVTVANDGVGIYRAHFTDDWLQGRGMFGGLVLATLLRAMEGAEPDTARRTRAIAGDICGPVLAGEAEIRVTVLRRGKNQTNLRADLFQNDGLVACATALLSPARTASAPPRSPAPPTLPPFDQLPVLPVGPPLGPAFGPHYEVRAREHYPFTGGKEAIALGTVREAVAPSVMDAPTLVALLDVWWPALYATESTPRAMSTVTFSAQVLVDPATIDPNERLVYRSAVQALNEGFSVEFRELWQGDRLVALNQQTFVLLR